jgi:hypothetical protein
VTDELYHAPPRLSDLKGDELREALFERHDRAKEAWLASRRQRGPIQRLAEWVRDWLEGVRQNG